MADPEADGHDIYETQEALSSLVIACCENAGGILHHVSGEIVLSQMG